ncbi:MAG: hypothetical protein ACO4AI_06890 [Prochlorothrix sp.]|nr:hypothetical protein [Prochlorothrix sp.]
MTPKALHYTIDTAQNGQQILLRIWEPAPSSRKPYLYQLNYKLASEEAARQVLNQHLALMGGDLLSTSQPLQAEGEFSIAEEPTIALSLSS